VPEKGGADFGLKGYDGGCPRDYQQDAPRNLAHHRALYVKEVIRPFVSIVLNHTKIAVSFYFGLKLIQISV
jgi:hypothetical protein